MANDPLFEWLVNHHVHHNLPRMLPHIEGDELKPDGEIMNPGYGEIKLYRGILIIKNGTTFADKMRNAGMIASRSMVGEPKNVSSAEELSDYLQQVKNPDYVHIAAAGQIAPVKKYINFPRSLEHKLEDREGEMDYHQLLPADFLHPNGAVDIDEIGKKTMLALDFAYAFEEDGVKGYLIKQTPYEIGGKVVMVGAKGLEKEFFLMKRESLPLTEDKYLDPEHQILGILRTYEHGGNGPRSSKLLQPDENGYISVPVKGASRPLSDTHQNNPKNPVKTAFPIGDLYKILKRELVPQY